MWIGEQEVDLHVIVDGKTITQMNSFVYLGGTGAWRRMECIMWGRKLKKQLKGKVLEACVVPAFIYGLGTLALTEKQEEKVHIAENNWVQRIYKVPQEDRRKMKELRE